LSGKFQFQLRLQLTEISHFNYEFQGGRKKQAANSCPYRRQIFTNFFNFCSQAHFVENL